MIVLLIPLLFFFIPLLRAELKKDTAMIRIFKPLETSLIIIIAGIGNLYVTTIPGMIILTGLCFSLAGDVALIQADEKKHFLLGLSAFLGAHILYTTSFIIMVPGHWAAPESLTVAGILSVSGLTVFLLMFSRLEKMKVPVALYIVIISFMVFRSFSVFRFLPKGSIYSDNRLFFFIGAVLFYISDIILAMNRYYRPMKYNRISILFYYSGQTLIAIGTFVGSSILF